MAPEVDRHEGEEMVEVAFARDQVEAEMLQGLLETEGIRSMLQPTGINGPQVGYGVLYAGYGGGAQRVMVWESQSETARGLLAGALVAEEPDGTDVSEIANAQYLEAAAGGRRPRGHGLVGGYARIWFWSFAAMAAAFGIFLLLRVL
jgi:Putative prokaryotic signal transducing protein